MNTRQPIQAADTPAVLSLVFSSSRDRFAVGLSNGIRVLRTDDCLTTFEPRQPLLAGAASVVLHNDRYLAFVPARKSEDAGGPNYFHFWDMKLGRELTRHNLYEPVKGLRINAKFLAVILAGRTVAFQYQDLDRRAFDRDHPEDVPMPANERIIAPNRPHSLHVTADNTFALACMHENLLILPATSQGQIQLITLKSEVDSSTKRVLRAHKTALRCMALSPTGSLLATASVQGTLIRVFSTTSLNQLFEFRRGMEMAVVHDIAFSQKDRWLACTSDKGTLHVFDLDPAQAEADGAQRTNASHVGDRQSHRRPPQNPRSPVGAFVPPPSISNLTSGQGSVTPSTAIPSAGPGTATGSIQEYYHLLPHPATSATSPTTTTMRGLSGPILKPSPFTPRIFTDVRSAASTQFYIGNDPPTWQSIGPGGTSLYTWTVTPGGGKKRVKKPIRSLPNDPAGRPPKGFVVFEGEDIIYVIGGGSDARWEKFQLLSSTGAGYSVEPRLEYIGFRQYLKKQYND